MIKKEVIRGLEMALYRFDNSSKCGQAIIEAMKIVRKT